LLAKNGGAEAPPRVALCLSIAGLKYYRNKQIKKLANLMVTCEIAAQSKSSKSITS